MSPHKPDPASLVLVTGGCGFLGRALVEQLLNQTTHDIRVLALAQEPAPTHWPTRVTVVRGDITQAADVARATEGCTQIFHLAAMVGDSGTREQHERVTVGGTAHVFDQARRSQAEVILTTSICAYGDAIQKGECREDTPPGKPQGLYGQAKQGQERLAWRFRDEGGRVCVVRPANIIGPGCGPWLLDAAKALRQGLPALVGGGKGNAALAIVDNVADFMVQASCTPQAYGQAFNIHDGLPVTWAAYFNDLAKLMQTPAPKSIPRGVAYLGASLAEPLFRRFMPSQRPPVTREALNLIAWDNRFPLDKAQALGWTPKLGYAQIMARIQQDITDRGL